MRCCACVAFQLRWAQGISSNQNPKPSVLLSAASGLPYSLIPNKFALSSKHSQRCFSSYSFKADASTRLHISGQNHAPKHTVVPFLKAPKRQGCSVRTWELETIAQYSVTRRNLSSLHMQCAVATEWDDSRQICHYGVVGARVEISPIDNLVLLMLRIKNSATRYPLSW
jgi:hypothetical protein